MLTAEGAALLWAIASGASEDSLAGASIVVSDGVLRARQPVIDISVTEGTLTLTAVFGEQDANFEWTTAEVLSANGVVVDLELADNGRKAAGAVWTYETALQLGATNEEE